MEESEFVRDLRRRLEAHREEMRRVDEQGCWTPPHWPAWSPGETLRRRRALARLSQRELSALCGIDQGDISRVESGCDALWSTWDRLAHALGCGLVLRLKPLDPERKPGS
jgi:hypothetical protein